MGKTRRSAGESFSGIREEGRGRSGRTRSIPGRRTDNKQPKAQQGDSPLNQFQARLEKPTESQPGRGGLGEPQKRREAESV